MTSERRRGVRDDREPAEGRVVVLHGLGAIDRGRIPKRDVQGAAGFTHRQDDIAEADRIRGIGGGAG